MQGMQQGIINQQNIIQGNVQALQHYNQQNPGMLQAIMGLYAQANGYLVTAINMI
jgi:hypothetical protein